MVEETKPLRGRCDNLEKVDCILDRDAAVALDKFTGDSHTVHVAISEALARNNGEVVVLVLDRETALDIFKSLQDSQGSLQSAFSSLAQCLVKI